MSLMMKVKVAVEPTGRGIKRACVKLYNPQKPYRVLELYTYYHEDIILMEELIAEQDAEHKVSALPDASGSSTDTS